MTAQRRRAIGALNLVLAVIALGLLGPSAQARVARGGEAPDHAPTLGVKYNDVTEGFGQVRPRTVSYGGDGTSLVEAIHWSSWGAAHAVGRGRAAWVWPGWCDACGSVELPATVVAFDKRTCGGHSAYAHVEWYFPSRGMSFDPRLSEANLCTGKLTYTVPKTTRCAAVTLRASDGAVTGRASGLELTGVGVSCGDVRRFVAGSGAARYLHRNARFATDGWFCGSELSMQEHSVPPQSFSCETGDFSFVSFSVRPPDASTSRR